MVNELGDAIERDPDVRRARAIAQTARTRLVAAMTESGGDALDLAEAQGMLDTLRAAVTLAEDAEDRVLAHRGLLTPAEASERAARRRPPTAATPLASPRVSGQLPRGGPRREAAPGGTVALAAALAAVLALALLGLAGVRLARRYGLRLPPPRWLRSSRWPR